MKSDKQIVATRPTKQAVVLAVVAAVVLIVLIVIGSRGLRDFDSALIKTTVTWWHAADDKNAPLSAARRVVAKIPKVALHVWQNEGHFASLTHDREIVAELLSRNASAGTRP